MTNSNSVKTKNSEEEFFSCLYTYRECPLGKSPVDLNSIIRSKMEELKITDLNDLRMYGSSIIFMVISTHSPETLKLLIDNGLKTDVVNSDGVSAYDYAVAEHAKYEGLHGEGYILVKLNKELVELLEKHDKPSDEVINAQLVVKDRKDYGFSAVLYNKRECLLGTLSEDDRKHIDGVFKHFEIWDINTVTVRGEPLVFFVIDTFSPDILDLLIKRGLLLGSVSHNGETPLEFTERLLEETKKLRTEDSLPVRALKEVLTLLRR